MSLTGDFAKLQALVQKMNALPKGDSQRTIVRGLADFSEVSIRRSFRSQSSPEGVSWEGGPYVSSPMLRKSGKMAGAFVSRVGVRGFSIRNRARYAHYHQHGAILRGRRRLESGPVRQFSGPLQKGKSRKTTRRKRIRGSGNVRGFLQPRPILPGDQIPGRWLGDYKRISEQALSRLLGG